MRPPREQARIGNGREWRGRLVGLLGRVVAAGGTGLAAFSVLGSKEATMARNRSSKTKRAVAPNTVMLREAMPSRRTPGETSAREPAAAPFDTDDEAAGRPAPPEAIERAIAREQANAARNVRLARSPGAVGPLGRAVLWIAAFALASVVAIWALLAF